MPIHHPRSERTNETNEHRIGRVLEVEVEGIPLKQWPMRELRRRHALALVDHMLRVQGRATTGVVGILRSLSAMAEDAITDEVADLNPFKGVRVRANDPRAAWGDVGHLTVFIRRDDAEPERKWSATVFDHENRPLVTAHAPSKGVVDERAISAVKAMSIDDQGDETRLYLGPARNAELLEVVTIIRDDGSELVIHAMKMRPKYRRLLPGD